MKTGLFIVAYEIGTAAIGAQQLELNLSVYTPNYKVNGQGVIKQSVNPPLDVHTELTGDFTYMTVMPNITHILVVLEGSNDVKIRMVLSNDWASGTANYSYIDNQGKKISLENIPVRIIR